jgi:hypothetical protein
MLVNYKKCIHISLFSIFLWIIFLSGCIVNPSIGEVTENDVINASSYSPTVEPTHTNNDAEIDYDIKQAGEPFSQLEKSLESLLKGTDHESIFSSKTEGMLNWVSMKEDGTTIVDFNNFSNIIGSTSAEKGKLYRELNGTVFEFDETKVYYQFDGSFSDWCYWLQTMEEPVTREDWEGLSSSSYEFPLYSLKSSFTYATPFAVGGDDYYSPYLLTYANKMLNSLSYYFTNEHAHNFEEVEEVLLEELINKTDEINKGKHIAPLTDDYFLGIEVINNFVELNVKDISELSEVWFFIKDKQIIILLKGSGDWLGLEVKENKLNNMWKGELEILLHFANDLHSLFWKEHF